MIPALQPSPVQPGPSPGATRRAAALGAVAVVLAGAAGLRWGAAAPDAVPASEALARAARLASFGPLPLAAVPPGESAGAVQAMGLPAAEQAALLADAGAGRVRLVWITLYDSDAEDGDVAEVASAGWSRTVPLWHAPVRVAVPVGPDQTISLTGVVDGRGGGVTVGLVLPSGLVPLPPLSVGQTLRLPVAGER